MATRSQNEHDFPNWEEISGSWRRYWVDRPGAAGFVRYVKTVDANEATRVIVQEVYNSDGQLVARHQQYPVDTGHRVVR